jgi:hypothetical protein
MKKRLALSLNQDQSKSLEKIKTMALITGFYEAKSVSEELKKLDSLSNGVLKKTNIQRRASRQSRTELIHCLFGRQ